MPTDTPGLHHVTGIVGDVERHAVFYAKTLGLRLLRRTVNYEDILQYHLYFGDATGSPGSVFTIFPDPNGDPGRTGKPGYEAVAFAVPPDSLTYWQTRLQSHGVPIETHATAQRFDDRLIGFEDPSGTRIELVESDQPGDPWTGNQTVDDPVPRSAAIRGLYGVTAQPTDPYGAASVLETLGFEYAAEEPEADTATRIRYRAPGDRAVIVDLCDRDAPYGREGPGTLHHAAVRVADRDALLAWHDLFRDRDYTVSRVKDRHFFHSLYVRGPGGLLIELATTAQTPDGPATATGPYGRGLADPAVDGHATGLYLPPRFEADRDLIERQLPAVERTDGSRSGQQTDPPE